MTEQEQREEAIDSISMSVMESYEMACEWPKYDSFVDICDEHDLEPSRVLYGHCINLAKIKWQALTMGVKAEIAKAQRLNNNTKSKDNENTITTQS